LIGDDFEMVLGKRIIVVEPRKVPDFADEPSDDFLDFEGLGPSCIWVDFD
jgi:hypothetical protein